MLGKGPRTMVSAAKHSCFTRTADAAGVGDQHIHTHAARDHHRRRAVDTGGREEEGGGEKAGNLALQSQH